MSLKFTKRKKFIKYRKQVNLRDFSCWLFMKAFHTSIIPQFCYPIDNKLLLSFPSFSQSSFFFFYGVAWLNLPFVVCSEPLESKNWAHENFSSENFSDVPVRDLNTRLPGGSACSYPPSHCESFDLSCWDIISHLKPRGEAKSWHLV